MRNLLAGLCLLTFTAGIVALVVRLGTEEGPTAAPRPPGPTTTTASGPEPASPATGPTTVPGMPVTTAPPTVVPREGEIVRTGGGALGPALAALSLGAAGLAVARRAASPPRRRA